MDAVFWDGGEMDQSTLLSLKRALYIWNYRCSSRINLLVGVGGGWEGGNLSSYGLRSFIMVYGKVNL